MASPQETPGRELPQYSYSRLPTTSHTRLIELFPAVDSSAELRCQIHVVEQALAKDTYDAVSYTWGPPEFTCELIVVDYVADNPALNNCQTTLSRIPITPSLDGALRRFRSSVFDGDLESGEPARPSYRMSAVKRHGKPVDIAKGCWRAGRSPDEMRSSIGFPREVTGWFIPERPGRFWADAVCIDQGNPKEKAHHIPLMTSIYRDAGRVFVWLGGPQVSLEDFSLLDHPWFGRRWVIQEATVNRGVVFYSNNENLDFDDVATMVDDILSEQAGQISPILATRAASVRQMGWISHALGDSDTNSTIAYSICKLMRCFDQYDCADPRDRVFTLASLAGDVDTREVDLVTFRQALDDTAKMGALVHQVRRPEVMVIYEKEASVEDIYTLFGHSIGEAGNLPWVLGESSARLEASSPKSAQYVVPSWVPDWRIHSQRPSFWTHGYDVRYPLRFLSAKYMREWTGNDLHQPTFSIRLSPTQSQNTKQRVFRMQLPLTHITRNSEDATQDDCRGVAPFRVTWRSETFPSSIESWQDTAICMKKTFHEVWRIVQIHAANASSSLAIKESSESFRDQLAERFAYILIAGGMFMAETEVDKYSKLRLCDFADEFKESLNLRETDSHAASWSKRHQLVGRDIDLLYDGDDCFDKLDELSAKSQKILLETYRPMTPRVIFLMKSFLLSDINFASDKHWEMLIRIVAWTMQSRCVFACDVENTPPDASPMDIIGIGSNLLDLDDRIVAIPFHDPESDSNRMRSLLLSNLWSRTYIVRPVSRVVDGELGKDASAPTFRLIGDCFLSTVRWLSPQRGLMPPEWFTFDDDSVEEAALKEKHRSHFSEVVEDSVIYFV